MRTPEKIVVGTRGSKLALHQTQIVTDMVKNRFPGLVVEVRIVKTMADKQQTTALSSFAEQGVFVKELEEGLLGGEIDLAVHSLKDMPTELPDSLSIAAVLPRESPLDCLVSRGKKRLSELAPDSVVGTGSARRSAFILRERSDLRVEKIRGNLDTRLKKVELCEYDAIVVSHAAMTRMSWTDRIAEIFSAEVCLPAPGQGAIAVELRSDDEAASRSISFLDDFPSHAEVASERSFLRALGGGCRLPIGSLARIDKGKLRIEGEISALDGSRHVRGVKDGRVETVQDAETLGELLAHELLARGGKELVSW